MIDWHLGLGNVALDGFPISPVRDVLDVAQFLSTERQGIDLFAQLARKA